MGAGRTVAVQVAQDSHCDNTLQKSAEVMATTPAVIKVHLVSGDQAYLLRVVVEDTRDYGRLQRE